MPTDDTGHTAQPALQPTPIWVFRAPWRLIAFGFGSGLLRPAPGTWGTALGWLLWVMLVSRLPDAAAGAWLVAAFALGCWCCQRTGREMGQPDYGGMVWDEMVAIWLVLWLSPPGLMFQLLAFIVFRTFDIIKPSPIRFFDSRFKNGFGVMWDDIVAAAYTLLVMAILVRLQGAL